MNVFIIVAAVVLCLVVFYVDQRNKKTLDERQLLIRLKVYSVQVYTFSIAIAACSLYVTYNPEVRASFVIWALLYPICIAQIIATMYYGRDDAKVEH